MASIALKRLLADLKEIQGNPLPNIVASPVNDNMLEWHANCTIHSFFNLIRLVRSHDGELKGVDFHMILKFTNDYPLEPPKVFLCTHIPHTNVFEHKESKKWTICLDMLQQGEFAEADKKGLI